VQASESLPRRANGSKTLRWALIEAARAAGRTKNTYLAAQYHRLAARRGSNRAAVAVGHTILVVIYHIIKDHVPYRELGGDYFDKRKEETAARTAIKKLESLGYNVTVEKIA
jgi:transposase